jgi:hypothetical protein
MYFADRIIIGLTGEKCACKGTVGDPLAIPCEGIYIGKNVNEGDTLYTYMTKDEIGHWTEKREMLNEQERELFDESEPPTAKAVGFLLHRQPAVSPSGLNSGRPGPNASSWLPFIRLYRIQKASRRDV